MTTLIIARHGNTFGPGDTPTRVGARTDLPLVEKGEAQARALGHYLADNRLIPDVVYASQLQRTYNTAQIAIKASAVTNPIFQLDIFNEVDYGPDENQTEDAVITRIGADAIQQWDTQATVPSGWKIDTAQIKQNWIDFADQISAHNDNETVLVVTSNGIARFAPYITGDFDAFRTQHPLKLSTGALGILKHQHDSGWHVTDWNLRPTLT